VEWAVAAGFAVGAVLAGLAPLVGNPALHKLCPWYAGLFALGMAAAVGVGRSPHAATGRPRWQNRCAWAVVAALVLLGPLVVSRADRDVMFAAPAVGLAAAGLLVWLARRSEGARLRPRPVSLKLLESRAAVALGSVYYSLYLIHYPILALAGSGLRGLGVSPG